MLIRTLFCTPFVGSIGCDLRHFFAPQYGVDEADAAYGDHPSGIPGMVLARKNTEKVLRRPMPVINAIN